MLNLDGRFQTHLEQQIKIILELLILKIGDQNNATTKAFTVFAFVDFDYWFLYPEVGLGDRLGFTTLTVTINLKIKHLVYRHYDSFL